MFRISIIVVGSPAHPTYCEQDGWSVEKSFVCITQSGCTKSMSVASVWPLLHHLTAETQTPTGPE